MGFSYILLFMAALNITGAFVAIIVVERKSSAIPDATLPIILAVAGQTRKTSASDATEICSTLDYSGREYKSHITLFFVSVPKVSGVMNS